MTVSYPTRPLCALERRCFHGQLFPPALEIIELFPSYSQEYGTVSPMEIYTASTVSSVFTCVVSTVHHFFSVHRAVLLS